jgi:hypothetical protein
MNLHSNNPILAGAVLLAFATCTHASIFNISFSFSGLTDTQQSYFTQAENYWENLITGYSSSVTGNQITGVSIFASASSIDGVDGILGSTSISSLWNGPGTGRYLLSKTSSMSYDVADIDSMISNGTFTTVIEHEVAHVLGFGTLWTDNDLYSAESGQYTGSYGLAAYKSEFDASATYVPVELGGGDGTANCHWNEGDNGASDTGISGSNGRDMKYELMTGWLNSPTFLSNTTLQSFRDLGYGVISVPVQPAFWLFGSAALGFFGIFTRKRIAG